MDLNWSGEPYNAGDDNVRLDALAGGDQDVDGVDVLKDNGDRDRGEVGNDGGDRSPVCTDKGTEVSNIKRHCRLGCHDDGAGNGCCGGNGSGLSISLSLAVLVLGKETRFL
jgi:hypothetical protein